MPQPEFLEAVAIEKLVSKVQFQNYEPGEFTNIGGRTLNETIELVAGFPWQEYRQPACVKLTGPSITIEHPAGKFLKLGPYFNNTFCLYYFDESQKLQVRIVNSLDDCYEAIKAIYNNTDTFVSNSKAQFYEDPKKHFVTNSFEYTVTKARISSFIKKPALFDTFLFLLVFTIGFTHWEVFTDLFGILIGGTIYSLIVDPNLYLFFDYYYYSKDLCLRLAKGHQNFYFGPKAAPKEYLKPDIQIIRILSHQGARNPWGHNTVFQIIFKNGEVIRIPNLLIKTTIFVEKFPAQNMEWRHKFFATI